MEAWHLWLLGALFLFIAELLGTGFVALALGFAALVGMLAALLSLPLAAQWISFAIAAAILAPWLRKKGRQWAPSQRRSSLAGEPHRLEGWLVLDSHGQLKVKVESDTYLVRSLSDRELTPGNKVVIHRFDGITALVD